MRIRKRLIAILVALACITSGCSGYGGGYEEPKKYTHEEAVEELKTKVEALENVSENEAEPYIYKSSETTHSALSDISVFPITVKGNGDINIEIAAATELSDEKAPNDLINVWAEDFNKAGFTIDGRAMSVSVRKITSGEVLTYVTEAGYKPDVYIPSAFPWADMAEASGIGVIKLTDRLVGNTAGILMHPEVYDTFIKKYKEVTVGKVVEANLAGDLKLAVTNPYTSTSTLNLTAEMLRCFDPENPLSKGATTKLMEFQKTKPQMAYTTSEMKTSAIDGIVNTMVMEEQAYFNVPELKDYVYTPAGVRHDHPTYTFDYVSPEKQAVARKFVEYCLTPEAQSIANKKGFNLHNDYKGQDTKLDGAGYLAVQKIWKISKDGGQPVLAVFVTDVSDSMRANRALNTLQESLISAATFINSDNYIGLVSYSDKVNIGLKLAQFDKLQQAKFLGAVNSLSANGLTATYDAVLVALKMLEEKGAEIPDAEKMLILLSDGDCNAGYRFDQIINIVGGMDISVYTIGYNLGSSSSRAKDELSQLSGTNEAELINADTDIIINQLRDLFNVRL